MTVKETNKGRSHLPFLSFFSILAFLPPASGCPACFVFFPAPSSVEALADPGSPDNSDAVPFTKGGDLDGGADVKANWAPLVGS